MFNISDLLSDAVPESLKNMLLVMDTAGIFKTSDQLWQLTWQKLETFLPNLMTDLFGDRQRSGATTLEPAAARRQNDVEKRIDNLKLDDNREIPMKDDESLNENFPVTPTEPPKRHPTFFVEREELRQHEPAANSSSSPPADKMDEASIEISSATAESANMGQNENEPMADDVTPKEDMTSDCVMEEVMQPAAEMVKEEITSSILPPVASVIKDEVTSSVLPPISSRIPFRPSQMIPPPPPAIVSLPSRPTFAPMPPPPPGQFQFHSVHT